MRPDVHYAVRRVAITGCQARVIEPWSEQRLAAVLATGTVARVEHHEEGPVQIAYALPPVGHLPEPFDFGTASKGADHLAVAILADLFDEVRWPHGTVASNTRAMLHRLPFRQAFVLPQYRSFELDGNGLLAWAARHEAPCEVCEGRGDVLSDDPADYGFGQPRFTCPACEGLTVRHVLLPAEDRQDG